MLFEQGVFTPQVIDDPVLVRVLQAATTRAAGLVRTSDVLCAVIDSSHPGAEAVLNASLIEGAAPRDLVEAIEVYNPRREGGLRFDGRRERFAQETLEALDAFAADPKQGMDLLLLCVLEHLDDEDRRYLKILDRDQAAKTLRERLRLSARESAPLFEMGRLRSEEFTADAWAVLERASEWAGDLGDSRILPPHTFLALLSETEGPAEHLIRLDIRPPATIAMVKEEVAAAFRRSDRSRERPPLHQEGVGEGMVDRLERARLIAATDAAERVDSPHLLSALLTDPPPALAAVLEQPPLNLSLSRLRDRLDRDLGRWRAARPQERPFRLGTDLPPHEDLTWLARTQAEPAALHLEHVIEPMVRALHRKAAGHILITALPGVGSTTLLKELARHAAGIEFLRRKRLLRVDCRDVPSGESKDQLAAILDQVAGRTDVIVCLDGLASLIQGADQRLILRSALKQQRIRLIGTLDAPDYEELIGSDHEFARLTTRIDLPEPGRAAAQDMTRRAARTLRAEFGVEIDDAAADRAVVLSADYLMSERLPSKAVKVLARACEDLDFRRSQQASQDHSVTPADIDHVISELAGVPRSQVSGVTDEGVDYAKVLAERVVGQHEAVEVAARELRRIKAGLAASGQPASVMMLVGLTGVGKTELAKAVAALYSASGQLRIYPMENFPEPHSVSGIIGSPPGYVAHEHGGRLINDLNADPYAVFLLDEAEKAHPEVWRPFLNLFDEGWIIDQRGVKARGDRAVFILTSNIGHETISRMSRQGRSVEEIAAAVEQELRALRHPRSDALVFPAEFLSRIRHIVVFRTLDLDAMRGIARNLVSERRAFWQDRFGKDLRVPGELVEHIAATGHAENMNSGGHRGGRIIRKLVSDLIEDAVTLAAERDQHGHRASTVIDLSFDAVTHRVGVRFG